MTATRSERLDREHLRLTRARRLLIASMPESDDLRERVEALENAAIEYGRRLYAEVLFAARAEQTHDELHEAIHNTCTKPIHGGER